MFRRAISSFIFCIGLAFNAQAQPAAPAADDHHDDHAAPQLYPATIVIDPRQVVSVVVKINARLKNLRNLYVGQRVARDQVLGELESAELETV